MGNHGQKNKPKNEPSSQYHLIVRKWHDLYINVFHHVIDHSEGAFFIKKKTLAILLLVLIFSRTKPSSPVKCNIFLYVIVNYYIHSVHLTSDKLIHLTENAYTKVQLYQMERTVLSVMEFQIYIPSPQLFLLRYTKAALREDDDQFVETCFYLLDSHLTNSLHSTIGNSKLAAAAVLSSCLLYHQSVNPESLPALPELWTPTLQHYSGIFLHQVKDVLSVVSNMLDMLRLNIENKNSDKVAGTYNKYKSMSQHKRLVLAKHLQIRVVAISLQSVEDWLCEIQ